jgi:hypothetical protein
VAAVLDYGLGLEDFALGLPPLKVGSVFGEYILAKSLMVKEERAVLRLASAKSILSKFPR